MAAIESNLLIKSRLEPPTGSGLKDILSVLEKIDAAIARIDNKAINIAVNISGGKAALNQLNQLGQAAAAARSGGGAGGVGGPTIGGGTGGAGRAQTERITVRTQGQEGEIDEAVTDVFQSIKNGVQVTERSAQDGSREVINELDIGNKRRIANERKLLEQQIDAPLKLQKQQERIDQLIVSKRAAIARRNTEATKIGAGLVAGGFTQGPSRTSEIELVAGSAEKAQVRIDSFNKTLADGTQQIVTFNTATGRLNDGLNLNTQTAMDFAKVQRIADNEVRLANQAISLQAQGFREHKRTIKDVQIGQQQVNTELREFRKVTGSALTGNLQVELKKMNTRTGEMSTSILRANDAMRLLGDSVGNAVSKVILWTGATTAIFGSVAAIGAAIGAIRELEANTVFLARVGANFGATFSERLESAKQLTQDLIQEARILGVSATEAQQAAAVFARTGQTREQVFKSTRAALIASRIAELEVADAARLLSAATLQFRLEASDLLPTLDSLNTLSNRYRVSTDDLLQSISRSGSVYADTNGELEQLAAQTAIVSQVTGRSGAEIGNAFKTIISRLAAPETRGNLLREIGLAAQDSSGETKNFLKIVQQLQIATEGLTQAESDAVLVQVAGARQLNVLRAAVNNAVDEVLAYAKANRESGSAITEAIETSETLDASLKRLQSTFVALADSQGKGFGPLLKDLTDATSAVVNFLSKTDSAIIKIGIFAIVLAIVRFAVVKLSTSFGILAGAISSTIATLLGFRAAATGASSASTILSAALTKVNIVSAAFTVGLFVLIDRLAASEQKFIDAELANRNFIDSLNDLFSASGKRVRATREIVDSLNEQIAALEKLKKLQSTPAVESAKKATEGRIIRLAEEVNAEGRPEIEVRFKGNELLTAKLLIDAQRALNAELEDEAVLRKNKLEDAKETRKTINQEILKLERFIDETTDLPIFGKQIGDRPEQIEKLKKQLDELDTIVRQLQVGIDISLSETLDDSTKKAAEALERLGEEFQTTERHAKLAARFPRLFGSELQNTELQIEEFTLQQRGMIAEFERLNTLHPDFDKFKRELDDTTEKLEAATLAAQDLRIEGFEKVFGATVGATSDIFQALQEQEGRLDFLGNKDVEGGPLFERANAIRNTINAAKQDAERIGAILQDDKLFTEENREESQALANAIQKRIDQDFNKAIEGEVNFVKEILDIEEKITEEKQKQNIETQRALGLLSEEDKILLLRQAQFFQQNPNRQVNALEQFLADADTNKINQQFFGRFLQQGFNPEQQFDRRLLALGVGQNRDLDVAEKGLQGLFGPNGRDEFIAAKLRDIEELARVQNQIKGEAAPNIDALLIERAIFDAGALDVVVNLDPLDFRPLVDAFREAVLIDIQENRDAMVRELEDIWTEVRQLRNENANKLGRLPELDGE